MRRTISARWSTVATSRTVTRSSTSRADSELLTASSRTRYRSRIWTARSARPRTRGIGSRVRLRPRRWTATTDMSSETVMTGTSIWRPTRSAVRWRVPVSEVGMLGSGTRCTLARATRDVSEARMMAPSILASSDSRWGVNSASRRKPPEHTCSTSGPSPTTIIAPMPAWRMRSRPSRSGVPGATSRRESSIASVRGCAGTQDPPRSRTVTARPFERTTIPTTGSDGSGARLPGWTPLPVLPAAAHLTPDEHHEAENAEHDRAAEQQRPGRVELRGRRGQAHLLARLGLQLGHVAAGEHEPDPQPERVADLLGEALVDLRDVDPLPRE